jgi:hypothetical protein
MTAMTRSEREDLQRLIRQRERVLKSAAKQRSAELLADFENQIGSEYSFDQDEVWAKAAESAEREVKKAQAQVAARCRELGIPDRFAPSLSLHWRHRGYDASRHFLSPSLPHKRRVLRLEPAAAVSAKVSTAYALRHDPLQTQLASLGEYERPLGSQGVTEQDAVDALDEA